MKKAKTLTVCGFLLGAAFAVAAGAINAPDAGAVETVSGKTIKAQVETPDRIAAFLRQDEFHSEKLGVLSAIVAAHGSDKNNTFAGPAIAALRDFFFEKVANGSYAQKRLYEADVVTLIGQIGTTYGQEQAMDTAYADIMDYYAISGYKGETRPATMVMQLGRIAKYSATHAVDALYGIESYKAHKDYDVRALAGGESLLINMRFAP